MHLISMWCGKYITISISLKQPLVYSLYGGHGGEIKQLHRWLDNSTNSYFMKIIRSLVVQCKIISDKRVINSDCRSSIQNLVMHGIGCKVTCRAELRAWPLRTTAGLHQSGNHILLRELFFITRLSRKSHSVVQHVNSKSDNIAKKNQKKKNQGEAALWHFSTGKYKQKPNIVF